jgi:signal transduction histidine kinase/CheY-like chemotaxis protein
MDPWPLATLALLPVLGAVLVSACQELIQVRGHRGREHLWTSLTLLSCAAFVVAELVQARTGDPDTVELAGRIRYAAAVLFPAFAVPTIHAAGQSTVPRRHAWILALWTLALCALLLGTDLLLAGPARRLPALGGGVWRLAPRPALGVVLLHGYYAVMVSLALGRPPPPGAHRHLPLALLFAALGIHDALLALGWIVSTPLFHFGFLAVPLAISGVVRRRLDHITENLQASVRERTAQLEQALAESKEARKQLLLADRLASVGTLAAGTAHEINNPLAYVSSNLQLLQEEIARGHLDPAVLTDLVEDAWDGADRIRRIVDDLGTFARVEEEREEERFPVDLAQLLDRCISMTRNEIRHRARLVREYREGRAVLAEPRRLSQVFVNLLVNAAQALPTGRAGEQRIHVRVYPSAKDEGWMVAEVVDTGPGIPEAHRSRIFEPFFTTKATGEGSGLGLALCHGIVAAHGGRMEVESEEGRGTTMRVCLPGTADDAVQTVRTPLRSVVEADRPARILLVDDEPALAKALKRALRGHRVEIAADGQQALELLAERSFDLVLCDLMMPHLSGPELFERLRDADPAQADRVLFITGGAFDGAAQALVEEMPDRFLKKPVDLAVLRRHADKAAALPLRRSRPPTQRAAQ